MHLREYCFLTFLYIRWLFASDARGIFWERGRSPLSSRIKPISRGSYDRLKEFYASVRTDCWPRRLRKGGHEKDIQQRDYIPGFRICRAYREIFSRISATRRSQCLGDFMYTEGYVALLKPFSDNTSLLPRSPLLYDLAHADAPLFPFIFCIMYVCSHGHPVHVIRKQTLYIVFPIGLRPDVSVGVLQWLEIPQIDGRV